MTVATAHSNIALVKYWGKRDTALNLPGAGSLSMALAALTTRTEVRRAPARESDHVVLDGSPASGAASQRVSRFLDLIRVAAGSDDAAEVVTTNDFPTAAGLASSASGFAALALAAVDAYGLDLSPDELSVLARRGSGSAARSIPGGWALMHAGEASDGRDAFARQIAPAEHWDLRCVVLITATGAKDVGSTAGMNRTMMSSPYYPAWIETVDVDLADAEPAVMARDFELLATVAERSCLRMHASAIAADPGVLYWNGQTVELIHRVRSARASGIPVFFTIDAGPHVKVFCEPSAVPAVRDMAADEVKDVIVSAPGGPARIEDA